jgi:transposase
MLVTYQYRLLPRKRQYREIERILEDQRQLYNAALEERIGAYRRAGVTKTYFDQAKGLTEWRRSDAEASRVPVSLQRATLKRVDEAYRGFFRRVGQGAKPGFPRFRGRERFDSFGFAEFDGVTLKNGAQNCSECGAMVPKEPSDRWHYCPDCGLSIDRDLNAARNIFNRAGVGPGLQNVAGRGMRAGGNLDTDSRRLNSR